jgi:putative FmdB family regulatory protein
MPVYEYACNECHTSFEVILTMKEHEEQEIICPRCDSRNVEQDVADFVAVTSRKS